jgi:hypothetical protein
MFRVPRSFPMLVTAAMLSACASKYAQVPARLDLEPYGRIALVTFSTERDKAALSTLATQRFAEAVLRSQGSIEILELGAQDSALIDLAERGDGPALAAALGREKNVPAVFVGQLRVSGTKARGRLSSPTDLKVRAEVRAELSVQLLSTRTGGTMWRSSAAANGTVGRVSLSGGLPSVAVRDTDEAYSDVVQRLVVDVTRDFRPTFVKQ